MAGSTLAACVLLASLAAASATQPPAADCEVAVIGAGLGGLYSAWRLSVDTATVPGNRICVFEAKQRAGGRILTVHDPAPGFANYTIDLGAYRFHRQTHRHFRLLTESVLRIPTLCYTNPLNASGATCGEEVSPIISARGRVFGLRADGRTAGDFFASYKPALRYFVRRAFRWGPGRPRAEPRSPYAFIVGPESVIPVVARRYKELLAERDYARAMRIADEMIQEMRGGRFRGALYADITVLQVATLLGWTQEERAVFVETGYDTAEGYNLRRSVEHAVQLALRSAALAKDSTPGTRGMVTPIGRVDGAPRRTGMHTVIEKLLAATERAGVRVFYHRKVTLIERAGPKLLRLRFEQGQDVTARRVIANIGQPDLLALGLASEPLRSAPEAVRAAVDRAEVKGYSKMYCFWEDAWWLTKLGLERGRTRVADDSLYNLRYHDGHVVCRDRARRKGCRGGLLVSYSNGDLLGAKSALYTASANARRYTPISAADNLQRLIPGRMTPIERILFDDVVAQVRRVHASSLAVRGFRAKDVIKTPAGCLYADWRNVGTHLNIGPGQGNRNIFQDWVRPAADVNIALVSEAWGQVQGWAEAAVNSAERALFHEYKLERPAWMDKPFHTSVIVNYNRGL